MLQIVPLAMANSTRVESLTMGVMEVEAGLAIVTFVAVEVMAVAIMVVTISRTRITRSMTVMLSVLAVVSEVILLRLVVLILTALRRIDANGLEKQLAARIVTPLRNDLSSKRTTSASLRSQD
jgi:hypothetical protein